MSQYDQTLETVLGFAREAGAAVRNMGTIADKLRMRRLEKSMQAAARMLMVAKFEYQDAESANVRGRRENPRPGDIHGHYMVIAVDDGESVLVRK